MKVLSSLPELNSFEPKTKATIIIDVYCHGVWWTNAELF